MEYELLDTGVFDDDRYFDVEVEYAKAAPEDVLVRITARNRGPDEATLHLVPTLWFRNTWSAAAAHEPRPAITEGGGRPGIPKVPSSHSLTLRPETVSYGPVQGLMQSHGPDPPRRFLRDADTNFPQG